MNMIRKVDGFVPAIFSDDFVHHIEGVFLKEIFPCPILLDTETNISKSVGICHGHESLSPSNQIHPILCGLLV
jgi:hypothetical protein